MVNHFESRIFAHVVYAADVGEEVEVELVVADFADVDDFFAIDDEGVFAAELAERGNGVAKLRLDFFGSLLGVHGNVGSSVLALRFSY